MQPEEEEFEDAPIDDAQGEVVDLAEDDVPMSDDEMDEPVEEMQETTINDFLMDDSVQGFFDHKGT